MVAAVLLGSAAGRQIKPRVSPAPSAAPAFRKVRQPGLSIACMARPRCFGRVVNGGANPGIRGAAAQVAGQRIDVGIGRARVAGQQPPRL